MSNTKGDTRLVLMIFYEGPWGRLSNLCYGLRRDGELRFEIPANPRGWRCLAGFLGDFFENRDRTWRERYVRSGTEPPAFWKRKMP